MPENKVFKFLDSYGKDDAEVFFGRENEVREIYQRCSFSNTLIVYGRSGTGKTSIVQCGLNNAFDDQDWLPVFVRRTSDLSTDWIEAIREQVAEAPKSDKGIVHEVKNLYLDHFKPVYFIFDQFEELFIFGDDDEIEGFFDRVQQLVESEQDVHLIFVVREEYLAYFSSAEEKVEGLLDNRIRIEHMSTGRVKLVVEQMCQAAGIGADKDFIDELTERMSSASGVIELSYLQVYLDAIRRKFPDSDRFTVEMIDAVGNFGDVLKNFLQWQLDQLDNPARGEAVLKAFVSTQGTKRLVGFEELGHLTAELGTPIGHEELEKLVNRFVDGRILRQLGDEQKFELRHDTLAAVIYQRITLAEKELLEAKQFVQNAYNRYQKNGTHLRNEDLDYLAPYAKRLYLKDQQKAFMSDAFRRKERRRQRNLRLTQVGVVVLLALLVFAGYKLYQNYQEEQLQAKIDESHRLAELSRSPDIGDPMLAFLLAEKAHEIYPGTHTHRALLEAYDKRTGIIQSIPGDALIKLDSTDFLVNNFSENKCYRYSNGFAQEPLEHIGFDIESFTDSKFTPFGFWDDNYLLSYSRDTLLDFSQAEVFDFTESKNGLDVLVVQHDSTLLLVNRSGKVLSEIVNSTGGIIKSLLSCAKDTLIFRDSEGLKILNISDFSASKIKQPRASFWRKVGFNEAYSIETKETQVQVMLLDSLLFSYDFTDIGLKEDDIRFLRIHHVNKDVITLSSLPKKSSYSLYFNFNLNNGQLDDNLDFNYRTIPLTGSENRAWYSHKTNDFLLETDTGSIEYKNAEFITTSNENEILLLSQDIQDGVNVAWETHPVRLLLINVKGKILWEYPLSTEQSNLNEINIHAQFNNKLIWIYFTGLEPRILVIDKNGKPIASRNITKRYNQRQFSISRAISPIHFLNDSTCIINDRSIKKFVSRNLQSQSDSFQKSGESNISNNVLIQVSDTATSIHFHDDNGQVTTHHKTIYNTHKLDNYWYSARHKLVFYNRYGTQETSLYSAHRETGLDSVTTLNQFGHSTRELNNEHHIAYYVVRNDGKMTYKKNKVEKTNEKVAVYFITKDLKKDSVVYYSSLFHQYYQCGGFLFAAMKDSIYRIDLENLHLEKLHTGIDRSGHMIHAFDSIHYYSNNSFSPWSTTNSSFANIQNEKKSFPDTLYGVHMEKIGYNSNNPTSNEKHFTHVEYHLELLAGAMASPYKEFSGVINVVNESGRIVKTVDYRNAVGEQPHAIQILAFTENIQNFLVNLETPLIHLCGSQFESFFSFDRSDIVTDFIHDKYLLTRHRLRNRYELFPINGNVAIEMVREQGRLGEVREFTEKEKAKYGIDQ